MPNTVTADQTLAELATAHSAASRVFLRHRLDFCCGGRRKLRDACNELGLDAAAIVAEIAAADEAPPAERWETKPLAELIAFVLTQFHEPLRKDLPALLEAARKIERVHGSKASCPRGLAALLERLHVEIQQHLAKEEQVLFPAIRAGIHGAPVHMPIRVMMEEHDDHGASLRRLRELATDFNPPPEACATWRALYAGLEKLESELIEHIHLENNVLFPRALQV